MSSKKTKKILLIEDDLQLVAMYRKRFELEGFDVETADDGSKALTMIKTFEPDLVILDIMLPKVDGIEILRMLREAKETEDLLVVVLTNLNSESTIERIYKYGVTEYIVKADMTPVQVVEKAKEILKIYDK